MGVMSCSRYCCENIMCDTYIDSVGYVCYECESEFKEYLNKEHKDPQTYGEINKELKIFMETEKDFYATGQDVSIDDFFNEARN